MSLVLVIWDDAKFNHDYLTVEKAQALRPSRTYSVGHLICGNSHGVTVAQSAFPEEPDQFSEYLFVPQGMVVRVVELRGLSDDDMEVGTAESHPSGSVGG